MAQKWLLSWHPRREGILGRSTAGSRAARGERSEGEKLEMFQFQVVWRADIVGVGLKPREEIGDQEGREPQEAPLHLRRRRLTDFYSGSDAQVLKLLQITRRFLH